MERPTNQTVCDAVRRVCLLLSLSAIALVPACDDGVTAPLPDDPSVGPTVEPTGTLELVIEQTYLAAGLVTLSGPAERRATFFSTSNSVSFRSVPPGEYTVTATVTSTPDPVNCGEPAIAVASVQAGQLTSVTIENLCSLRTPQGSELEVAWSFARSLSRQTGICPDPLPDNTNWFDLFFSIDVSMTLDVDEGTLAIVGLDPAVTVVGHYDAATGHYAGQGITVLGDGASIRTEIEGRFGFELSSSGKVVRSGLRFDEGGNPHAIGMMREHRVEPGGAPICSEEYRILGWYALD